MPKIRCTNINLCVINDTMDILSLSFEHNSFVINKYLRYVTSLSISILIDLASFSIITDLIGLHDK